MNPLETAFDDSFIVSANPGFYEIRFRFIGKPSLISIKEKVFYAPIIAWKISGEGRSPITPDDPPIGNDEMPRAVLTPLGSVIGPDVVWKDFDSWCATTLEVWQQRVPVPPTRVELVGDVVLRR